MSQVVAIQAQVLSMMTPAHQVPEVLQEALAVEEAEEVVQEVSQAIPEQDRLGPQAGMVEPRGPMETPALLPMHRRMVAAEGPEEEEEEEDCSL